MSKEELQLKFDNLSDELDAVNESLGNANTEVNDLQTKLNNKEFKGGAVAKANADIEQLNVQISELTAKADSLKQQMADVEAEADALDEAEAEAEKAAALEAESNPEEKWKVGQEAIVKNIGLFLLNDSETKERYSPQIEKRVTLTGFVISQLKAGNFVEIFKNQEEVSETTE